MPGPTLRCCACSRSQEFDPFVHRCTDCGEALELTPSEYLPSLDPGGMSPAGTRRGIWRYRSALPEVATDLVEARVAMGEGGTPLLRARRIEDELGCGAVWLKDESRNPTGSFKDRGTAVGVAVLAGLGFDSIGTVSTGNMARSVAAYAARAGMNATIWLGADTPAAKLAPITVHGARLLRFNAPYGEIYQRSLEWSRARGIPFVNSDSSLRVEGQRTIAFEIAEQLGGRAPDWLLVPTSSGGNFSAIAKGFTEAAEWGWVSGNCRLAAVQSAECAPIAKGWEAGADDPATVPAPRTICGAISNPTPPSGRRALAWIRKTNGCAIAVPDSDIVRAQLRIAELSGRYVQPASAASFAALERLRDNGTIAPSDTVVLLLTGSGSNAPPPDIPLPAVGGLADI